MSEIEIKINSNSEAEKVLSDVYQNDSSATWVGDDAVSGQVLTAQYDHNRGLVRIYSNYYTQYSLEEMFL